VPLPIAPRDEGVAAFGALGRCTLRFSAT
jgi:hypothetical protein